MRVPAVLSALERAGLTPHLVGPSLLELSQAPLATDEQLQRVHSARWVSGLREISRSRAPTKLDADTYITPTTFDNAAAGVGATLALVDFVCEEAARQASASLGAPAPSGFALCRPPGHHALPSHGMGFCLLSTAAVAARHAQAAHGLRRVLIVDFDVHHGNGTAAVFDADPSVLYISTHQAGSFPGTGALRDVGTGLGAGATCNVPLPGGSGDAAARSAFDDVVLPLAERFNPEIIIVSAGYDAHWRDPLAGLSWRGGTYHHIVSQLRRLAVERCAGRMVLCLEGGYDFQGLGEGCVQTFRALMGMAPAAADPGEAALRGDEPNVAQLLREARAVHGLG